jgi:hypothetical protein
MAGITFNIILIRVYKDRLRPPEIHATTGDANRKKTLSGLRSRTAHSTTNRSTPESQATQQANVEIVMRGEVEN